MAGSNIEAHLKEMSPVKSTAPDKPESLKSALEKDLETDDAELGKELARSRAEEIIERRRLTIARMRAGSRPSPDTTRTPEHGKEWLTDIAQGLLERGMDPSIVGRTIDYLLGTAPSPMVGLPGATTPPQGVSFNDMKEIFKMGQESNKTDPAIAQILNKLTDRLTALETKAPVSQRGYLVVQADGTIQEVDSGKPVVVKIPPPPASTGSTLEEKIADHRHEEKMAEITVEKDHKEKLGNLLATTAERLGQGIGHQFLAGGGGGEGGDGAGELVNFICPKTEGGCGYEWQIPAGIPQVVCPKCHTIFNRKVKQPQ